MSQAAVDPVFLADHRAQGEPGVCFRCHAPLHEQQPAIAHGLLWLRPLTELSSVNQDFDPSLHREGVTCVVCHLGEDGIRGTFQTDIAPHPVEVVSPSELNQACERCHQLDPPPFSRLDRPITDTYREGQIWQEETGQSTCRVGAQP